MRRAVVAARLHENRRAFSLLPLVNRVARNVGKKQPVIFSIPRRAFNPDVIGVDFFQLCIAWNERVETRIETQDILSARAGSGENKQREKRSEKFFHGRDFWNCSVSCVSSFSSRARNFSIAV